MQRRGAIPTRYRLWLGIALLHLSLVGLAAAYVDVTRWGAVGRALETYGMASGADSSYGFFAPGIFGQLRAQFDVIDKDGKSQTVSLETGASGEADVRVGDIIDQFADPEHQRDPETAKQMQRTLSASLAGTIFARYPYAAQVVVRLEEYRSISRLDYIAGKRPSWAPVYTARFERRHPFQTASKWDDE